MCVGIVGKTGTDKTTLVNLDDSDIILAAKAANAHEFIPNLTAVQNN
jgi:ABC-type multidrug transport system fused ATPase/permease subunit